MHMRSVTIFVGGTTTGRPAIITALCAGAKPSGACRLNRMAISSCAGVVGRPDGGCNPSTAGRFSRGRSCSAGAFGFAAAVGSAAKPPYKAGAPPDLELQPPLPGGPPAAFAAISSCTARNASSRVAVGAAHGRLLVVGCQTCFFGAMADGGSPRVTRTAGRSARLGWQGTGDGKHKIITAGASIRTSSQLAVGSH